MPIGRPTKFTSTGSLLPSLRMLSSTAQMVRLREEINPVGGRAATPSDRDHLHIEVHDVLANDNHTVILQLTKAKLGDRVLEDRVVYVFHIDDGFIVDAYFQGDPRVQEAFYPDNPPRTGIVPRPRPVKPSNSSGSSYQSSEIQRHHHPNNDR